MKLTAEELNELLNNDALSQFDNKVVSLSFDIQTLSERIRQAERQLNTIERYIIQVTRTQAPELNEDTDSNNH